MLFLDLDGTSDVVSITQYAEGLLRRRIVAMDADRDPGQIANRLVYRYKDHGFVIDHDEAVDVFGSGMIRSNTEEYDFANKVYEWLSLVSTIVDERGRRQFFYVGGRQLGAEIINMGASEGQQQAARWYRIVPPRCRWTAPSSSFTTTVTEPVGDLLAT